MDHLGEYEYGGGDSLGRIVPLNGSNCSEIYMVYPREGKLSRVESSRVELRAIRDNFRFSGFCYLRGKLCLLMSHPLTPLPKWSAQLLG